jgi:hypothetical protein
VKPPVLYRIAAVLLVIFAIAHAAGFRQSDPAWEAGAVVGLMRSHHFGVQGFSRTYWDFFVAAGLTVDVFFLFAAVVAWQLSAIPATTLATLRGITWAFAVAFAAMTALSWRYLFYPPIVFSAVVTLCAATAAWRAAKPNVAGWP